MVRPRAVMRWVAIASLGLFCSGLLFASAHAFADPYVPPAGGATEPSIDALADCPPAPAEAYAGEDHAAGELRLQRGELAELCDALAARSDEVSHRLWWLVAEAIAAGEQRALTNTLLTEVRDALDPPVAVHVESVDGGALVVEDAAGEQYSDDLVSAIDASGNATKEGLWFLIGLLAMASGFGLYKQVRP